MARADTLTLIPLDRMAYHLQLDPYHFNGITSDLRRNAFACEDTWYQHNWQGSGKISRESLATALRQAEDVVSEYLQWYPVPQWVEEEVPIPGYYKTEMWSPFNSNGRAKSVVASWGMVQEVGRKTSALIGNAATVFSDADGDGFNETVTVTIATTVTDTDEIHLYYPGHSGRDDWEIRPVDSITIAAGVATIVFQKYLIPLWNLVETIPAPGDAHILIDGDDDTNFLATVDVYRVYADPSQHITLYYDPSEDCTAVPCEETTVTGCLVIKNSRLGILSFSRADWDAGYTRKYFAYNPVKGRIYYRAGKRDTRMEYPNRQMDTNLERMISFYALSLLDTEMCGCTNTRNIWQHMTRDLSQITQEQSFILNWEDARNPLGTTFAALRLWKYIQNIRIVKSQAQL